MSTTEGGFFVLDSENSVVGDKPKVNISARDSVASAARKRLGDISNLPLQPKPLPEVDKAQFVSTSINEYVDQLRKENAMLMKLLADRNKIIELSGTELQKLRVNLQKLQQQNLQLAQANSQMLGELNSGKDRLKALQHELGCKNGLLRSRKVEMAKKAKSKAFLEKDDQAPVEIFSVGSSVSEEASEADIAEKKPCNTKKKHRSKSLCPSTVKQDQLKEKTENRRASLRRQSARFKSEKPEANEDMFETDEGKFPECSLNDDQMLENGLTSMCSSLKNDNKESSNDSSDEALELQKSSIGRPSHLAAKKVESYEEIPVSKKVLINHDKEGRNDPIGEAQELRRSSIGRPSRLAAKKVESYKEISVNKKMRRNA